MNVIAQKASELLKRGEVFVLATIISHRGSTPRNSGSKMIVTADGRGIGTIGGGLLEAETMARAAELIDRGRSAILAVDLSNDTVDGPGMICGGQVEVLLDHVSPAATNLTVFNQWRRMLERRQHGCLLTTLVPSATGVKTTAHCLLTAEGAAIGDIPLPDSEREALLARAARSPAIQSVAVGGVLVLMEPAVPICSAYLLGAGHVAQATANIAARVGFRVSVADDREAFANRERFPDADEIRVLEDFEQAFSGVSIGNNDFIVILTRGHLHDKTALAQALSTPAGYIGMIGSRRKRDAIYSALSSQGVAQDQLDRVRSPIGLAIGAETPEEIAVSIVAEMIQVRGAR